MSFDAAGLALRGCLERGVREFVVCAGARNAPIVLALARTEGVTVWSHFEERGAGFFALGRIVDRGLPVAVVTTSGTAAAELLPSIIEAHYEGRPLIAVTADRPERFRGSGAPQAIEQVGLFGKYVEGWDDLGGEARDQSPEARLGEPGAPNPESGLSELFEGWSGLRPWHLNVCLEEDAGVPEVVVPEERPAAARRKRAGVAELVSFLNEGLFRGLVVMVGGLEPEEREEAFHFVKDLGAPVVADATSGLREALGPLALCGGDRLLRSKVPGKVLRLGDVPVGRFWRDLENLPEVEVLSVTRTGFSGLARKSTVITGRVDDAVRGLGEPPEVGDAFDWLEQSGKRRGMLEELLEGYPDSEPSLVRMLSTYATIGESIYLGNSLPIREWNLGAQVASPLVNVRASRGANGIDGQVSTWLGASAEEEGAWGIFGDLTALYDLAAPALMAQVEPAGRVLAVLNNGGGRIFERLPRLSGMADGERRVMTNSHQTSFESWAALWEMEYVRVASREEFEVEPGADPILLEICPDERQTAAFWEAWES